MRQAVRDIVAVVEPWCNADWMVQVRLHWLRMAAADDDDHVNGYANNVVPLINGIETMIVEVNYDSMPSKVLDLKLSVRNLLIGVKIFQICFLFDFYSIGCNTCYRYIWKVNSKPLFFEPISLMHDEQ